jgi:hypothetical protein
MTIGTFKNYVTTKDEYSTPELTPPIALGNSVYSINSKEAFGTPLDRIEENLRE